MVSHQLGRPAPQAAPLRDLCVLRVSALDSSSLGLTLNLRLSTFNCLSFLSSSSPHLCALCVLCGENSSSFRSSLISRHSPLTTNSFTIRTSKTPLPQPLYNPHLQAPLGSAGNKGLITPLESALTSTAGNKGLITPLESALTKNSPASLLESALTKRWGVGVGAGLRTTQHKAFYVPAFPLLSTLNCRLLTASAGLRAMAVVRRRRDAHAPKLIVVILLMKNVPLFAAFQNFLFLRSDALADFQLNLFFFSQNRRKYLHDLLADGVAVLDEFHVVAVNKHFRNLVREADNFFAAQAHCFSNPSNQLEFNRMNRVLQAPPSPSAASGSAQGQLAVPRQLLLHFLVHLLVRDARAAHLVLVIDQDLPHFFVQAVLDGKLFLHALADAVGYRVGGFGFDLPAFHQAFYDFVGHVRDKVPYQKHLGAFPLPECKRVSLLAA